MHSVNASKLSTGLLNSELTISGRDLFDQKISPAYPLINNSLNKYACFVSPCLFQLGHWALFPNLRKYIYFICLFGNSCSISLKENNSDPSKDAFLIHTYPAIFTKSNTKHFNKHTVTLHLNCMR